MDFQSLWAWVWTLYCLGTGIVLGTVWTSAPLKRKVAALEFVLESDSLQKMERILMLEQELRWAKAKIQAQELDLARWEKKNSEWAKEKVQELRWEPELQAPQWNLSYWKFEGPKLQKRVLELEMELESLRSKTLWKE